MKTLSKILNIILLICLIIIVIGLFLHYFASGILNVDTWEEFAWKVNYNYYLGDALTKIGIIAFFSTAVFLLAIKINNKFVRK